MKKFIRLALLVLVVGLAISWFVAGYLVRPIQMPVSIPESNLPIDKFTVSSASGSTLAGWHLDTKLHNGVVVLFHGVKATRLAMFERAEMLFNSGYSVVMVDFQAHGESTGDAITIGYLEKYDVLAAIDYAKEHHVKEPVGVIGVSLGAASTVLASPKDIDVLVIESMYPDIRNAVHNRVKAKLGFLSWLPAEILLVQLKPRLGFDITELRPIDKISSISCPIFIISGTADHHTTQQETLEIFSSAVEPKQLWLVDGLAHEDIYAAKSELYKEKVLGFLNQYLIR